MKKLWLTISLLVLAVVPLRALVSDILPPTQATVTTNGTIITIAASATSGNNSGTRNCITNLSVDSNVPGNVVLGSYPCQFTVYDGTLGSGTTIWSVIVTTTTPSFIATWPAPVPGLQVMDLCGTRGNTLLIRTTCNSTCDASYNGFTDK